MSENIQLFAKQQKIYPRRVWGRYRKIKWLVMLTLLGIYYAAPWLRWERGGQTPDQAILIDLNHSRAYFFAIEIWPQEVYYITGILILAAISLFFVTSLLGRIWCGYACPQTVWTDLFVWVERLVQGDRNARKKLDESAWNFNKISKKLLTHLLWLIISLGTAGAWVFYFNDAPTLLDQIIHLAVPWSVAGWIIGLTVSTYLMAGFAREQVCTYMCPYARFQSAMFDKDTLIIAYDAARGEPRGKHKAGDAWEGRGHCIDCDFCVIACPMGIDIRNGLQMECIACGLCIDACDNVMRKVGLPKGLIRYDTASKKPLRLLRPRSIFYAIIISLVGGVMLYALLNRSPQELSITHDRNPLLVQLADGSIRNGYVISISNKTNIDKTYRLELSGLENASIKIQDNNLQANNELPVLADKIAHFRVFVIAPNAPKTRQEIMFELRDQSSNNISQVATVFVSK